MLLLGAALLTYFFPACVASIRNHHNSTAIFMLNLLLGWTFIGWVVALVWACTAVQHQGGQMPQRWSAESDQTPTRSRW